MDGVRKTLAIAAVSLLVGVAAVWSVRSLDPRSVAFAFVIVWLPMAWLGALSHVVAVRLPARYHELRRFEHDGRAYELVGVRLIKRLLRRGPLAVFNPHLHLPAERTPAAISALDQRMRDAEASHSVLFVLTIGVAVHAAIRGWWAAAGWTLLFDVLVNAYPVMLQRYNRALLARRYPPAGWTARSAPVDT